METDASKRKLIPVYSGFIKYFPDAIVEVAKLSQRGNDQHNPGSELHWDRSKSGDELDAMMRHVLDEDWVAVAWRAMAHLQKECEDVRATAVDRALYRQDVRLEAGQAAWERIIENSDSKKSAEQNENLSHVRAFRGAREIEDYLERLNEGWKHS